MEYEAARTRLVEELRKEVEDPRVLEAFALTLRERFVPPEHASSAYENVPLPLGEGQTISQPLGERARELLGELGYANVTVLPASSVLGCPGRAPYNAIVVGAAAPAVPPELADQLALGGRMVIPVGTQAEQNLVRVVRWPSKLEATSLGPCRFVPLIGPGAWPQETHGSNGDAPHSPQKHRGTRCLGWYT